MQTFKRKSDGVMFKAIQGSVLTDEEGRNNDLDGSFLKLQSMSSDETLDYLWPYFSDRDFTYEGDIPDEARTVQVEVMSEELLDVARAAAAEQASIITSSRDVTPKEQYEH